MAILSYGEHTHPPPPAIKLSHEQKDKIIAAVREGALQFPMNNS